MLQEPVFLDDFIENKQKEIETFIYAIFQQSPQEAFRRKNEFWYNAYYNDYKMSRQVLKFIYRCINTRFGKFLIKIKFFKYLKKLIKI